MRPRIAVPIPTSTDRTYNDQNWAVYAACLEACGAEPIPFPLGLATREAASLAKSCQAACLTGSPADVNPVHYGQPRDPASAPADPAREQVDRLLLEEIFVAKKPLLAICFGLQSLNTFCGGTLVQDLAPFPVNHAAGASVGIAHNVEVAPGSLLAELTANQELGRASAVHIPVNSSHHQAVGIAGQGLRITGRCPQDGVVEALELEFSHVHPFLLGVQWHPERTFATPASRRIFDGLVVAAQHWSR